MAAHVLFRKGRLLFWGHRSSCHNTTQLHLYAVPISSMRRSPSPTLEERSNKNTGMRAGAVISSELESPYHPNLTVQDLLEPQKRKSFYRHSKTGSCLNFIALARCARSLPLMITSTPLAPFSMMNLRTQRAQHGQIMECTLSCNYVT